MANTRSAKKMIRKIAHRSEVNRARRSRITSFVRSLYARLEEGKSEDAKKAFLLAEAEVMRGAAKNIMHKNKAARIVSAMARRLNKI